MSILLLHISDLHLRSSDNHGAAAVKIAATCVTGLEAISNIVVCITGDLTNSGKSSELDVSLEFLAALEGELKKRFGSAVNFFAVPGNHDCDFERANPNRQHLISAARNRECELTSTLGWECADVQRAFLEFLPAIGAEPPASSPYVWARALEGARTIKLVAINTAWMSVLKEQHGVTRLPIAEIEQVLSSDDSTLVVVLAHHPPAWLAPEDNRKLTELLANYADIVLFGHEHIPGTQAINAGTDGGQFEAHFALPLFNAGMHEQHGFGSILLDESEPNVRCDVFERKKSGGFERLSSRSDNDWRQLRARSGSFRGLPQPQPEHERWLNDCGLGLSHPRRSGTPTLPDLFVWPKLKTASIDDDQALLPALLSSEKLLDELEANPEVLIVGDELSGKTSLCKRLICELRRSKRLALYIDGSSLTHSHQAFFAKITEKLGRDQYGDIGWEAFATLPFSQRVLVVDNLHQTPLSAHGIKQIRDLSRATFAKIVLVSNADIESRSFDDAELLPALYAGLAKFVVQPLDHSLRYALVEKWVTLGREHSMDAIERERLVVRAKRQVDQLLDNRTVPALPAYVLIAMQQLEIFSDVDSAIRDGSQARMYDALITQDLGRFLKQLDLDGAHLYLAGLAGCMASLPRQEVPVSEHERFHRTHCEKYGLHIDITRVTKELFQCRVLDRRDDLIRFRHPYHFYYFYGRYVADLVIHGETPKEISSLLDSLQTESSYNALLFSCFHDRSGRIVALLERTAQSIYAEVAEAEISVLSGSMADLNDDQVRGVLLDGPRKDIRALVHQKQDEHEKTSLESEKRLANPPGQNESRPGRRTMKMNTAVKCLGLLGQVLRNQAGTTTASRKAELIESARSLASRIVGVIEGSLKESRDEMLMIISDIAIEELGEDREEAAGVAARFLRSLIRRLAGSIARRAAGVFASRHLERVLEESLWKRAPVNGRVFYLGALLECSEEFPIREAEEVWRASRSHDVALRAVVVDHVIRRLYLFPHREEITSNVCTLFKIQRRPLLVRSATEGVERSRHGKDNT